MENELKINEEEKSVKLKDLVEYMKDMEKKTKDANVLWYGLKKSLEVRLK